MAGLSEGAEFLIDGKRAVFGGQMSLGNLLKRES
jgi:hypothetical protein